MFIFLTSIYLITGKRNARHKTARGKLPSLTIDISTKMTLNRWFTSRKSNHFNQFVWNRLSLRLC